MSANTSQFERLFAIPVLPYAALRTLNARERLSVLAAAAGAAAGDELALVAQLLARELFAANSTERTGGVVRWCRPWTVPARHEVESAAAALVRCWPRIPAPARAGVLWAAEGPLRKGAGAGLGSAEARERAAAALLVSEGGWIELAPALGLLLRDGDEEVRGSAEAGLVRLGEGSAGGGGEGGPALRAVLAEAVASWPEHRMNGVFDAALGALAPAVVAFGGRGDPLASWLLEGTSESHMGLRGVVRKGGGVVGRVRAWEWLGRNIAATASLERIGKPATLEEHEGVLRRAHLLGNPVRARRVGMIKAKDAGSLWPADGGVERLSPEARAGTARLVGGSALGAGEKRRTLEPLLADRAPGARLAAVRALPDGEVQDFCFDAEEGIARHALLRVEPVAEAGLVRQLARSAHASVRRVCGDLLSRAETWKAGDAVSRLLARRALKSDRGAFLGELRGRVLAGGREERIGAIMMARALGVQGEIELELLGVAAEEETWVAATAVAALGDVRTDSASQAVRRCLEHPAGRVRANAVDVAARWARDAGVFERLIELKGDPHHRVRGSTVRALAGGLEPLQPDAGTELAAMLRDARPLHRLAGLWATERLVLAPEPGSGAPMAGRLGEFATLIGELARDEPEEPVRERAVRCSARMLARVRMMWREAPADAGGSA
jgi:hypothetical protein